MKKTIVKSKKVIKHQSTPKKTSLPAQGITLTPQALWLLAVSLSAVVLCIVFFSLSNPNQDQPQQALVPESYPVAGTSIATTTTAIPYAVIFAANAGAAGTNDFELFKRAKNGTITQLTNNPVGSNSNPRVSYDGKKVAFYSTGVEINGVNQGPGSYVMNLDGTELVKMYSPEFAGDYVKDPDILVGPSGQYDVIWRNASGFGINAIGRTSRYQGYGFPSSDYETGISGSPSVSPQYVVSRMDPSFYVPKYIVLSGSTLVLGQSQYAQNLFYFDEVNNRSLLQITKSNKDYGTSFSPDGKYVIFYSNRTGSKGMDLYTFKVTDMVKYKFPVEPPLTKALSKSGDQTYPSFSPDGKYVFYIQDAAIYAGTFSAGKVSSPKKIFTNSGMYNPLNGMYQSYFVSALPTSMN